MSNQIVKNLAFGEDAKNNVFKGIEKLTKAVSSTLGASGKCVLLENELGQPVITKDGVTVANSITLRDPIENMGATLLKEAARQTVKEAGDGTTTATVLAHSILLEAYATSNSGSREMKEGIESATKKVIDYLEKLAVPVEGDMVNHVATISSNNDKELGNVIAEAFKQVGKNGVVTMEISNDSETSYEVINGATIDKPLKNFHFITDESKKEAVLENPLVLLVENKIENIRKIQSVLEYVIKNNEPLLIIGEADEQVVSALAMNKKKGNIKVNIIDTPDFGIYRKEKLMDIALLTGATVVNEDLGDDLDMIEVEMLGKCLKSITNDQETIIQVGDTSIEVQKVIDSIQDDIKKETLPGRLNRLEKRLGLLSCKVAVIKVGASSEVELKEKQDRVEDAMCATKAAIKEGIVPGGGIALLNASTYIKPSNDNEKVLLEAIKAPYLTILNNAGLEVIYPKGKGKGINVVTGKDVNMIKSGIIDPLLVTKSALKNAASVATTILSTDCVINNLRVEDESNR
jgi:chaperonin GroEL|tara:strand:- start:298 stop:1851 length:1554 start_codon:yes stop_codon:yes gene_type:complete